MTGRNSSCYKAVCCLRYKEAFCLYATQLFKQRLLSNTHRYTSEPVFVLAHHKWFFKHQCHTLKYYSDGKVTYDLTKDVSWFNWKSGSIYSWLSQRIYHGTLLIAVYSYPGPKQWRLSCAIYDTADRLVRRCVPRGRKRPRSMSTYILHPTKNNGNSFVPNGLKFFHLEMRSISNNQANAPRGGGKIRVSDAGPEGLLIEVRGRSLPVPARSNTKGSGKWGGKSRPLVDTFGLKRSNLPLDSCAPGQKNCWNGWEGGVTCHSHDSQQMR